MVRALRHRNWPHKMFLTLMYEFWSEQSNWGLDQFGSCVVLCLWSCFCHFNSRGIYKKTRVFTLALHPPELESAFIAALGRCIPAAETTMQLAHPPRPNRRRQGIFTKRQKVIETDSQHETESHVQLFISKCLYEAFRTCNVITNKPQLS